LKRIHASQMDVVDSLTVLDPHCQVSLLLDSVAIDNGQRSDIIVVFVVEHKFYCDCFCGVERVQDT